MLIYVYLPPNYAQSESASEMELLDQCEWYCKEMSLVEAVGVSCVVNCHLPGYQLLKLPIETDTTQETP